MLKREEKERERRHDENRGWEREKEPAHQPARQKAKRALKNERSVFRKRLQTESISFSKAYFKTYLSLP